MRLLSFFGLIVCGVGLMMGAVVVGVVVWGIGLISGVCRRGVLSVAVRGLIGSGVWWILSGICRGLMLSGICRGLVLSGFGWMLSRAVRGLILFGVVLGLTCSGDIRAQGDCSDAAIMAMKGGWTKHPGPGAGRNYKDQASIYRFLDSVGRIFQNFYSEPKGIQARWYPTISSFDPIVPGGPTAYVFNSQYFAWYCNVHMHKMMLDDETGTDVDVSVNSLGFLLGDQVRRATIAFEGAPIYILPDKVGEWKGYDLYALPEWGPSGRCVVLARGGQGEAGGLGPAGAQGAVQRLTQGAVQGLAQAAVQGSGSAARQGTAVGGALPWKPATQEQYLKGARAFIEAEQKKAAGPSGDQQAVEDQKEIERIQNDPNMKPELKEAGLRGIRERQQLFAQAAGSRGALSRVYDDQIRVIDDYLHNTAPGQLQQPAVLPRQRRSLFDGSFSTLAAHGQAMIMVDADYFDRRLPAWRPQFMVLFWRADRNVADEYFRQRFESDFPVERLQGMLDRGER